MVMLVVLVLSIISNIKNSNHRNTINNGINICLSSDFDVLGVSLIYPGRCLARWGCCGVLLVAARPDKPRP